jgi:hypothetical protein
MSPFPTDEARNPLLLALAHTAPLASMSLVGAEQTKIPAGVTSFSSARENDSKIHLSSRNLTPRQKETDSQNPSMTVRCWVSAFLCLGRSRGRRRPSLCAWVSSDSECAPIFPQSDSKRLATEPLAHSSAPYPRAFDASARQSSSALLLPFSAPFDEPMPSEFSHALHGREIPAERTEIRAVRFSASSHAWRSYGFGVCHLRA